jgi:transposase
LEEALEDAMLPLESSLLGLPRYELLSLEGRTAIRIRARCLSPPECPRCGASKHWVKDRFRRSIRHENWGTRKVWLEMEARKFRCCSCGRTFHERFPGVLPRRRYSEAFRRTVVQAHREGIPQRVLSRQQLLGQATIERWTHELMEVKLREHDSDFCPRILGIDEHFFTRKDGYATTLCDLERHRIFDVVLGRSQEKLDGYFRHLLGRSRVELVCMDLSGPYRKIVRDFFPHACIVTDRFHVIRLVGRAFRKSWAAIDPQLPAEPGLRSLLRTHAWLLTRDQVARLQAYFEKHPVIGLLHRMKNQLSHLILIKHRTRRQCRALIPRLLEAAQKLRESKLRPLVTLGRTLEDWKEEIARMWRYTRNNGITEGFHTKMEMIQRRAYGFRNFENYRLRVRSLCGG